MSSLAAAALPVGSCGYGRVLLLLEGNFLVGMPNALGGAGAVVAFDVTIPASPSVVCTWGAPSNTHLFGGGLAARERESGIGAQLVAVA